MAFGSAEILAQVKSRVAVGLSPKQRVTLDYDILQLVTPALQRLAWKKYQSKNAQSLRKDFPLTPVLGVADLSSTTTIIPESITDIRLTTSDTKVFVKAKSHNDLKVTPSTDTVIWELATTTAGPALNFTDSTGISSFVSPIKVTANCIPTITEMGAAYSYLQSDLIDTIVEMFSQRGSVIAPEIDETVQLSA